MKTIVTKVLGEIRRRASWLIWHVEALLLLAAARALIRFVPFRKWRSVLGPIDANELAISPETMRRPAAAVARRVGRTIRRTAEFAPFEAVCLPQAIAGRWMLLRRGVPNQLFLGAKANSETRQTNFHAWLMHGEICLTGRQERDSFSRFAR